MLRDGPSAGQCAQGGRVTTRGPFAAGKVRNEAQHARRGLRTLEVLEVVGLAVLFVSIDMVHEFPAMAPINRVLGVAVTLGAIGLRRPVGAHLPGPEVKLLLGFVSWIVATGLLVAQSDDLLFAQTRLTVQVLALGWSIAIFAQTKRRVVLVCMALAAAGIVAQFGWIGDATQGASGMAVAGGVRTAGRFRNPNSLALRCHLAIVGTFGLWPYVRQWLLRAALVVLSGGFVWTIVTTASRKHFLGVLLLPVLASWFMKNGRSGAFGKRALVVIVAAAATAGMWAAAKGTLIAKRLDATEKAADERASLYRAGWELLQESPLAGIGWGNYRLRSGEDMLSHSEYVEVLASSGLVGGGLYFAVPLLAGRRLYRSCRTAASPVDRRAAGYWLAVLLTLAFVGTGIPLCYSPGAWSVIGVCLAQAWAAGHSPSLARRADGRNPLSRGASPGARPADRLRSRDGFGLPPAGLGTGGKA